MDSTKKGCIFWASMAYLGKKKLFWGYKEALKNIPQSEIIKATFSDHNKIKLQVMKEC